MTETPWHKSKEDYEPAFTFSIDVGQYRQLSEWGAKHDVTCRYMQPGEDGLPRVGAIGGRQTYSFTNTSLGQVCKAQCACGESIDLTEYGDW